MAVTFWGWSFVATKIALGYVTPAELIGLRYILGLPILATIIIGKSMPISFSGREWGRLVIAGGVVAAHFFIQVVGINYTSATNTGWIISVSPLAIAVLSVIFLKEKLNWRQMTGIAVATGGILLLVSHGNLIQLDWLQSVGDWLVLASAHTWAIYTIITRDLSRKHRPLVVTFMILAFSSVVFIIWMLFRTDWGAVLSMPLQAKAAVGFLGVICTGVAFWLWQEAVARMGAARAGFFLYLEPLATTLLAVPYLNESFGLWSAVGGAAVLTGVFIAEKRRHPSSGQ